MAFGQRKDDLPDGEWRNSLKHYIFSRQKELLLELIMPKAGERTLIVGAAGKYSNIFREKWCPVTGIVPSAKIMESVRKQVGDGVELLLGEAHDLPFSDNEFDIVAVIDVLETSNNPQKAIAEAIRVCRDRIFVGFLNKYSLAGSHHRLKEVFGFPLAEKVSFFSVEEIKMMIGRLACGQNLQWGSVIYFPTAMYGISTELEELVPHMKNPLGAFVGFSFPVKDTHRTAQNPLLITYQIKKNGPVTAPEAVRGMLKEQVG